MALKNVREIGEELKVPRDRIYDLVKKNKLTLHIKNGTKLYDTIELKKY